MRDALCSFIPVCAVGGVQSAGVGEFSADSSQRGGHIPARDQGILSRTQDRNAKETRAVET